MAKLTLRDFGSDYASKQNLNSNNAALRTAFDNTVSRDGTSPNAMAADFDMNGYRILNLPEPVNPTDPVRLEDVPSAEQLTQIHDDVTAINADLAIITNYGKYKAIGNVFDYINDNTIIAAIQAGTYNSDTSSYISAALTANKAIVIPDGIWKITNTISVPEGREISGESTFGTVLNSSVNGWTFQKLNPNGVEAIEAPKYRNFTLNLTMNSTHGIRWNSISGGFTDDNTSQQYMLRFYADGLIIVGTGTQIALQANKSFDGIIRRCSLENVATNINFEGTDISTIQDNRLKSATTQQILINRHGTFGSSTQIIHNDILLLGTAGAIVSGDMDLVVRDNFFEDFGGKTNTISLIDGFKFTIVNNRVQTETSHFVNVSAATIYDVTVERNTTTSGTQTLDVVFPTGVSANELHYFNNSNGQTHCYISGNTGAVATPIDSYNQRNALPPGCAALWTPGREGVSAPGTFPYAAALTCANNKFCLPPISSFGSLTRWDGGSVTLVGTYKITLEAASATPQVLNWQMLDNGVAISSGTFTLSQQSKEYQVTASQAFATRLQLELWNDDTTHNGVVFITRISILYT